MSQTSHQQLLWNLPTSSLREVLAAGLAVNTPDDYGDYLLTVASRRLQVESVQVLLSAGADPNVRNADRDTPLLCAIDCVEHNPTAALAVVESLFRAGANLEERGYMDKTPFLKACSRSSLEMVELLFRLGADPHATVIDGDTLDGLTFAEIFNVPLEQVQFIRSLR